MGLIINGNIQSLLDYQNPPTSVGIYGFARMFRNNNTIVDASNLLLTATTLAYYCYSNMFRYYSNLAYISVRFTNSSWDTSDWVEGVDSNGIFRCPADLPDERADGYGYYDSRIPVGWTKVDI